MSRQSRPSKLDPKAAVDSFLKKAGYTKFSSQEQFWRNLESRFGEDRARELDRLLQNRAPGAGDQRYDFLYGDPEFTRWAYNFLCPVAPIWLPYWSGLPLPEGDVLDLGSGSGLLTCFYAATRPHDEVVGVERSALGAQRGRDLATKLGLSNVSFVEGDVDTVQLSRTFAVVTSVTVMSEIASPDGTDSSFSLGAMVAKSLGSSPGHPLAESAARHLEEGGTYLSCERVQSPLHFVRWVSAQRGSGLQPDPARFKHVAIRALGASETLTAMASRRQVSLDGPGLASAIMEFYLNSPENRELVDERRVSKAVDRRFLDGVHFDVKDESGEGATRLYSCLLDTRAVVYLTTSRGFRKIILDLPARDADVVRMAFDDERRRLSKSPEIVESRPLDELSFVSDTEYPVG